MARGIGGDRQPSTKAAKFPRRTFFWTRVPKAGRCELNAVTCSQVFLAQHVAYYQGAKDEIGTRNLDVGLGLTLDKALEAKASTSSHKHRKQRASPLLALRYTACLTPHLEHLATARASVPASDMLFRPAPCR